MEPTINISESEIGTRVHFNFLKTPFLTQDLDLGIESKVFGNPINAYISLPDGSFEARVLDLQQNTETAKLLAAQLENERASFMSKESQILVYIYVLAETEDARFLFVNRVATKLSTKSKKEWAYNFNMREYTCCFKNYWHELKPSEDYRTLDPDKPGIKILKRYCSYKKKHVDVGTAFWCYQLDMPFQQKQLQRKKPGFPVIGFKVNKDGILGGIPLFSQFAYGSLFTTNFKQKENPEDWLNSGPIYANCKELYNDLSEKSQFLGFIRDSLNTTWLISNLVEEEIEPNQSFSYKLLGCSFYF